MGDIIKATANEAGCWIDGHWGQYGPARLVGIAEDYGYSDAEVIGIAERHMLECMYPGRDEHITDSEHEILSDATDEVTEWLNENVAPEGYSFGWNDGEYFLWSDESWDEDSGPF